MGIRFGPHQAIDLGSQGVAYAAALDGDPPEIDIGGGQAGPEGADAAAKLPHGGLQARLQQVLHLVLRGVDLAQEQAGGRILQGIHGMEVGLDLAQQPADVGPEPGPSVRWIRRFRFGPAPQGSRVEAVQQVLDDLAVEAFLVLEVVGDERGVLVRGRGDRPDRGGVVPIFCKAGQGRLDEAGPRFGMGCRGRAHEGSNA